jgi:hypothetical protein
VSPSLILKYLADLPRSVKAVFLLCIDALILGFSMLLAFAGRFDPDSIRKYKVLKFNGSWIKTNCKSQQHRKAQN